MKMLSVCLMLCLAANAYSSPPAKIVAQSALPKAKIVRQAPRSACTCGVYCQCLPGATCGCGMHQAKHDTAAKRRQDQYAKAYKLSLDTGRPLVLFVNCRIPLLSPPIDFVVCEVDELNGRKGPCVVIACDRYVCGELQGTPTAAEIQAAVARCRQTNATPPMMQFQPAFFGGGFGGGGGC